MADLLSNDTDLEMEKYFEAETLSFAGLDPAIIKNKQSIFNPETKTNEILTPMDKGGYFKIGEEPVEVMSEAPMQPAMPGNNIDQIPLDLAAQEVAEYAKRLENDVGKFDVADLEAAGYTGEQIEAGMNLMKPAQETPTVQPMTSEELATAIANGEPMIGPYDPTLREEGVVAIKSFVIDLAVNGLRDELLEANPNLTEQQIQQEIDARMPEFENNAGVYSNMFFGTGNPLGVGIADFATLGLMDMQEGARMFAQGRDRGEGGDVVKRALGAALMLAGAAEATGVGYGFGKLLKRGIKIIEPKILNMGNVVKQRINQPGEMPTVGMFGGNFQNMFLGPGQKRSFYVGARAGGEQNTNAINRVQEISKTKGNKRVKIEDLADYFEENHLQIYGRKLNPDVDKDFNLAADAAADEILYQMDQAVNGIGWYDKDVKKTFALMAQTPGLEELADNETLRVIWSAIAAPTSIGNKVNNNTRAATAAFLQYLKTGKVPINPPLKGATTEGISGAGWGLKQQSVAAGMKVISYLIDTKGPEGFADWWLSPHTLAEITAVRKAAGLSSGPVGVGGGKDSVHLGAMVLGDKTGPYSLNINGYEGTTKDIWFSRSYNRHFGNMKNPDGSVAGQPRNQVERRRMEQFTLKVIDNLEGLGLSEQDAQAVLWFYEQGLFTDLGVVSRPGSFSEAMEKISNELRSGVRASDENKIGTESATAEISGFRSVSQPKRTVRSTRRNQQIDDEQSRPYARESGEGSEGTGLLVLSPNENLQSIYNKSNLALPKISETKASDTANQYNLDMTSAMSNHEFAAQVEIKSPQDLADARLFRTENGSGFAIKSDGDIVAVFQSANENQSVGYAMIQAAVEAGGRKLDAFETFLPGIYETAGFRPVARLGWSDEFAPPNWNKETFKDFNNGEPDVVFYVYDPDYFGGATDVVKFNSYDEAVAAQEKEISRLRETIDGY